MKRILLVAGLVLLVAAPAAQAGGLVGFSAGQSKLEADDFDESDTAWKLFGEWHFLKFLGIGVGYYDFGSPSDNFETLEVTAWNPYAVGILPIGNLDLFAKVGYAFWDVGGTGNVDGEDLSYGLGVAFKITPKFAIRGEYEIVDINPTQGSADLDMWSVGVDFRF